MQTNIVFLSSTVPKSKCIFRNVTHGLYIYEQHRSLNLNLCYVCVGVCVLPETLGSAALRRDRSREKVLFSRGSAILPQADAEHTERTLFKFD